MKKMTSPLPVRFLVNSVLVALWASSVFIEVYAQDKDTSTDGAVAENSAWLSDYLAAMAKAKEEKKDLVLVFTGTDWIEICKIFYRDILSAPEFLESVSERFVLVKLEFPKDGRNISAEQQNQNIALKDTYRVRGFPTLVLASSDGRIYGMNGYQPITPAEYADFLIQTQIESQKKSTFLDQAKSLSGLEKATALVKGIPQLPGNLSARFYREEMEQAIAADPQNQTGLMKEFRALIGDVDYATEMGKYTRDAEWGNMLKASDRYIQEYELTGEALQRVLMTKFGIYRRVDNLEGMISSLLRVVKEDPKTDFGKDAQGLLDKLRAQKLEDELNKQNAPE